HHPTAIRETIAGLRQRIEGSRQRVEGSRQRDGAGRILAVFEPRSNTLKHGVLNAALPASFAAADKVYIYNAGLSWDAPALFAPLGARARCLSELPALVEAIAA